MDSSTIRMLLDSTLGVPWTAEVSAPDAAKEVYASSCTSAGSSNDKVVYDYSITLDDDGEIIGATFGVTAVGNTSAQELLLAADLYFSILL